MKAEHLRTGQTAIAIWPFPSVVLIKAALPAISDPGYVTIMFDEGQEVALPMKKELTLINGIPVLS